MLSLQGLACPPVAHLRGDGRVRYRVVVEHRETYIVDASCAAEAQYVASDFTLNRGDSQYAGHVLEHSDESLTYECTQLETCQHTESHNGMSDHFDA